MVRFAARSSRREEQEHEEDEEEEKECRGKENTSHKGRSLRPRRKTVAVVDSLSGGRETAIVTTFSLSPTSPSELSTDFNISRMRELFGVFSELNHSIKLFQ